MGEYYYRKLFCYVFNTHFYAMEKTLLKIIKNNENASYYDILYYDVLTQICANINTGLLNTLVFCAQNYLTLVKTASAKLEREA